MRIFFDTNVLYDVSSREEQEPDSFLVWEKCISSDEHTCHASWHTVSTLSYLIAKGEGHDKAIIFLKNMLGLCTVASTGHNQALEAFQYDNGDFEDALQITSALSCNADLIISRDEKGGFDKSPIKVAHPKEFLANKD